MKHFLIFALKPVCYNSYLYFADSLLKALTQNGSFAKLFSPRENTPQALETLIGKSYDAVFDFNSELPRVKMDDGSYFLDHLHAPFYDIILDHPLYHHDTLKQKISNFHVLCLDENHKSYIKEHYPHISSVHLFLMTGEDISENTDYPKKEIDVLFPGTYTDYRQVEDSIQKCPAFLSDLTKKLIDLMLSDTSLTQEAALRILLPSLEEAEIIEETFPLHMQACFLCDTYLRAWKREQLLFHLAKKNVRLTLCRNGWRKSPLTDFSQIKVIDDTSFGETFTLFRKAKITLNLLPEFKNGAHDRVYSAMLNHSLCATDASPLLKRQFEHEKEILFYDFKDIDSLSEKIFHLLASPDQLAQISQNGYFKAKKDHSWQTRAAGLLDLFH